MTPMPSCANRTEPKIPEHGDDVVIDVMADTNEMTNDLVMELPTFHAIDMTSGSINMMTLHDMSNVTVSHPDHLTNPSGIVACSAATWRDNQIMTKVQESMARMTPSSNQQSVLQLPTTRNVSASAPNSQQAAPASSKASSSASIANLMNPVVDEEDADGDADLKKELFQAFKRFLPLNQPTSAPPPRKRVDLMALRKAAVASYQEVMQHPVFQNEFARRQCFSLGHATSGFADSGLFERATKLRTQVLQLSASAGFPGFDHSASSEQSATLQGIPPLPSSGMVALSDNQVLPLPPPAEDPRKRELQEVLAKTQAQEANLNEHLQFILGFFEDSDDLVRNRFGLVSRMTADVYRCEHLKTYMSSKAVSTPPSHSATIRVEEATDAIEMKQEKVDQGTPDEDHVAAPTSARSHHDGEVTNSPRQHPRKRASLSVPARNLLKRWFDDHMHHPYPTEEEKEEMSRQCGISVDQVNNWFINTRGRKWKPFVHRVQEQKEAGKSELFDEIVEKLQAPYQHRKTR